MGNHEQRRIDELKARVVNHLDVYNRPGAMVFVQIGVTDPFELGRTQAVALGKELPVGTKADDYMACAEAVTTAGVVTFWSGTAKMLRGQGGTPASIEAAIMAALPDPDALRAAMLAQLEDDLWDGARPAQDGKGHE